MGFFQDVFPIFKKTDLTLLESYPEAKGIHTFIFAKGENSHWRAGQHGIFSIIHKKIPKAIRPFSVASSASEDIVKITVGIGDQPSEFKQSLLEMKPGMKIRMRGPVGPMYLKEDKPTLLIAGGLGITPFRAMVKERGNRKLTLLYIDSSERFVYRKELTELADDVFRVEFLNSRADLYGGIKKFIAEHGNSGQYYVTGSREMVNSVAAYLRENEVARRAIKKDVFIGYQGF